MFKTSIEKDFIERFLSIINKNDYSYGVGMLLVSDGNKNMYHFDEKGNNKTYVMKNKHVYKIVYIYKDSDDFDIYIV